MAYDIYSTRFTPRLYDYRFWGMVSALLSLCHTRNKVDFVATLRLKLQYGKKVMDPVFVIRFTLRSLTLIDSHSY